jgi:hypothetical protein
MLALAVPVFGLFPLKQSQAPVVLSVVVELPAVQGVPAVFVRVFWAVACVQKPMSTWQIQPVPRPVQSLSA